MNIAFCIARLSFRQTISLRPSIVLKNFTQEISYVEKIRYAQRLKEDKGEVLKQLQYGKFLAFNGSKPLLDNTDLSPKTLKKPAWVSYEEFTCKESLLKSFVFLHVDDNLIPHFSIQLGKTDSAVDALEESHGSFFDLRFALLAVNWSDAHIISGANALLMFNKNFAFCGRCSSPTSRNAAGNSRTCSSCDHIVYPTSKPVGIVLVTDKSGGNAILTRQPRMPRGVYTCIAGFSDVGEYLEETVRREVAEEVGIEVDSVNYVASQHWPFPGSFMAGCYAVGDHSSLMNIDRNELEDAKWFPREEIQAAYEKVKLDPFYSTRKEGLSIPPPGTLSFYLIEHWLKRTPLPDIKSLVYQ